VNIIVQYNKLQSKLSYSYNS